MTARDETNDHLKAPVLASDMVCGPNDVDTSLKALAAAFASSIDSITGDVCDAINRARTEAKQNDTDLKNYTDTTVNTVLQIVDGLKKEVDGIAAQPAVNSADILAAAKADAAAQIAAALQTDAQSLQQLNVLLTFIQNNPDLNNIAAFFVKVDAIDKRVAALEAAPKLDESDIDCRSVTIVDAITMAIATATSTSKGKLMNCLYPPSLTVSAAPAPAAPAPSATPVV
jgi:hypothetical protein